MTARQWALVRASRVADRVLQRIADVGVAGVIAALDFVADIQERIDAKVCEIANLTAGEDER